MLMTFFCFLGLVFFWKEKKRTCCILMFFSTEFLSYSPQIKLSTTKPDFAVQSKTDVFKIFL